MQMANIKAGELRIGNYIQLKEPSEAYQDTVIEVVEISSSLNQQFQSTTPNLISFYCIEKQQSGWDFESDYFEPIPLTEEWLVEFGFQIVEDLGDIKYFETPTVIKNCYGIGVCKNHEEWTFYWTRNDEVTTLIYDEPHFQYVHQLQNLVFALTGEELTLQTNKH